MVKLQLKPIADFVSTILCYLLNILIRALICTALTTLLRPVMERLLVGRNPGRALPRNREVKSF